ncbi:MAG: fibronectin type III domain-containing protein, partial [Candidatus Omnitrophica bacterium]|nr:fibronectin type III domain-containing protein [Candidatus Omnitrophota bacterium]
RVKSKDSAGNLQVSSDFTFTTLAPPDTTAPVISAVTATSITSAGATISWTTNEASNTQVEYGLTTAYGLSTVLNTALVTAHSQALSTLQASTLYHYRVKSKDSAGNLQVSSDFTFTTLAPPDTTSPVISAVTSGSITSSGATITWTTNEASDTQVEYRVQGTTTWTPNTINPSLVTNHSMTLTGLNASTTYEYRVKSKDGAGNLATQSTISTLTTLTPPDMTPPVISTVNTNNLTSSGATITWTTNELSDTQIEYGLTTSYGSSTTLNTALITSHSQALSSLQSSTLYHYRVKSRDAAGNLQVSGDFTFTTPAPPDTTAPVISAVTSTSITSTGATINWTTNEASDSQVEYRVQGTTTWSATTINTSLVTNHSVSLTGLNPSTTYEYRVKSKDATNNLATQPTISNFTTLALPDTTSPDVVFTSPQISSTQNYTLTYTVDGQARSESWQLGSGENRLVVRATDQLNNETTAVHAVQWTAPLVQDPVPSDVTGDSVISVTTQDGFVLKYKDGNLIVIERPGEYTFSALQFDLNQNLVGGLLTYASASEIYYRDNAVIWWKDPQGHKYYLNSDNSVREVVSPQNIKTVFAYQKNQTGVIQSITLAAPGATSLYNAEGKLLKAIKANEDLITYDNGVLQSAQLASGALVTYAKTILPAGIKVTLSSSAPQSYPASITYDLEGEITEVIQQSGVQIVFQEGLPVRVITNGIESAYDFDTNPLGDFVGLDVNRTSYAHRFDDQGNLIWLKTPEAEFEVLGDSIRSVTLIQNAGGAFPQGTLIRYEETGQGKRTIVSYPEPDGRILTYQYDQTLAKDILCQVQLPDGMVQTFLPNGTLESFQTADGKFYEYVATPEGGRSILKRWQFSDGRVLYFKSAPGSVESPALDRVEFPDGRELREIVLDSEGKIDQAVEAVLDEGGTLLFTNRYESGRLRKRIFADNSYLVFQADGSVDTFTDAGGGTYRVSYENCVQDECDTVKLASASEVFVYSIGGTLLSYLSEGLTFEFDEMGVVKRLKTPFGEIESPVWKQTEKLLDGKVTLADKTEYLVENGFISRMNSPNGSEVIYQEGFIDQITDEGEILRFEYLKNGLQELEQVMVERNAGQTVTNDGLINFLIHPERFDIAKTFFASPIQNLLAASYIDTNISIVTKVPSLREVLTHCTPSCTPTWYEFVYDQVPQPEVVEVLAPAPNPALNDWNIGFLDVPPLYNLVGPYAFASSGATVENIRGIPSDRHVVQYDLTNPGTFVGHYYLSYEPAEPGANTCWVVDGNQVCGSEVELARQKTVDLSQAQQMTVGLKGNPGTVVTFELTDINQNRHKVLLRGIDNEERFFRIDLTQFSDVDLTKVRSLAFILESDRQMVKQGTLELSYLSFRDRKTLKFPEPNLDQAAGAELPSFQSIGLETWRWMGLNTPLEYYPNPGNHINYSTDSEVDFHFDGPSDKNTRTEVVFNYDHPDTQEAIEYQDLSGLSHLILGTELKNYVGYGSLIGFFLEDADGNEMDLRLKLETSGPNFYLFDLNEAAVDLKRIRSVKFTFTSNYNIDNRGDGHVWLRGILREGPIPYTLPNVETDQIYLLPNEKMSVSLADTNFSSYDFVNLNIKAPENATDSKTRLTIGSSSYTTRTLSPGWNHLIVPLSKFSFVDGDKIDIQFEGSTQSGYFIDNLVFFRFRANDVESLYPKLSLNNQSVQIGFAKPWKAKDTSFRNLIPRFQNTAPAKSTLLLELGALLTVETVIDYDLEGAVKEAKTGDGRTLILGSSRKLDQMILQDGSTLDYGYDLDGSLKSVFLNDPAPALQQISTADSSQSTPLSVGYGYDKIRELTRSDGSQLEYQYEFVEESKLKDWLIYAGDPPEGQNQNANTSGFILEITVVKVPLGTEPETYEIKHYIRDSKDPFQTGRLLSVVDPNGLVTVYEYQSEAPDSPLQASRTYYKGRVKSESAYEYRQVEINDPLQPGQMIHVTHSFVTDEEGTTNEFDQEGNLIGHSTSEGYQYEHVLEQENLVIYNGATYLEGALFRLETPDFAIEEPVTNSSGLLTGALLLYQDGHRTFFVDGKPYLTTRDVGEATFFDPAKDVGTEPYDTEVARFALAQNKWSETPKSLPQGITPEEVEIVRLTSRQTDQAFVRYDEGRLDYLRLKDKGMEVMNVSVDFAVRLTGATVQLEDGRVFNFKEGLHLKRTQADGTVGIFTPLDQTDFYETEVERWERFKNEMATFIRAPNEEGVSKKTDLGTAYYNASGRLLEVHLRAEGVTLKDLEFNDGGELIAARAVFQGNVTAEYRDEFSVFIPSFGSEPPASGSELTYFDSGDLRYEALKSNWNDWKKEISSYLLDPSFVIETEYSADGTMTTITKADRSVSLYDDRGDVDQVFSFEGRLLIDYAYDQVDHFLISVTLVDARKRLEEDTVEAKREIARQRVLALEELAERTQQAIDQLKSEIEANRQLLLSQRATLELYLSNLEGMKMHGRKAKQTKSQALDQLRGAIGQVNSALTELDNKLAEGISQILAERDTVSQDIEQKSAEAFDQISANRTQYLNEILRQELSPILHNAYRETLGRDPSEGEIQQAMAQKEAGTFDLVALRRGLLQ